MVHPLMTSIITSSEANTTPGNLYSLDRTPGDFFKGKDGRIFHSFEKNGQYVRERIMSKSG